MELLEQRLRPLTLLVAPAGAGKTATLALWAHRRPGPLLWLDGGRAEDRAELGRLAATGTPALVVVDDAHEVGAREWEAVVDAVTRDDLRVVLASRRDLPLPVVSLELSGHLVVLRGDHLRLTLEETTALVVAHAPQAQPEDVDAVALRADGWAAAVVLGAHALSAAADHATARAALVATDQPVLDYLLDEVFATLPAATRHVLLCTAHEDEVTEVSARVLSGDPDAPASLAQLAVDGMFVTRYDRAGGGAAWVYHPLLRELLGRETAATSTDAALVDAAHARAARHYAAYDRPHEALRHAVASGREELIVELLAREAPRLIAGGDHAAVARALAAVPMPLRVRSRALVLVAAEERRAAGDAEGVFRLVDQLAALPADADASFGPGGALAQLVAADEARLRLWLTRSGLGDLRTAIAAVRAHVDEGDPTLFAAGASAPDVTRLAALGADLAYGLLQTGDLSGAAEHARRAAMLARAAGSTRLAAAGVAVSAVIELLRGRPQTAATAARQALDDVLTDADAGSGSDGGPFDRAGCPEEACLRAVAGLGALTALDLAGARRELERARATLVDGCDPIGEELVRFLAVRILAEEGDLALARRIASGDADVPDRPAFLVALFELVRGDLALAAGDLLACARHAQTLSGLGWERDARLLTAAIALHADRPEVVPEIVAPVLAGRGDEPRAESSAAAARMLELLASFRTDGPEAAEPPATRLRRVLSLAAPERLVRVLLPGLSSGDFLELLRQEAEVADGDPFAAEAFAALRLWCAERGTTVPSQRSVDVLPWRAPVQEQGRGGDPGSAPLPEWATVVPLPAPRAPAAPRPPELAPSAPVPPLTNRELDVLQRLARGDSYLDIAQTLYITQNTVKTHVASLYRKLGAGRRAEALRRAWALGLLVDVPTASPSAGERSS